MSERGKGRQRHRDGLLGAHELRHELQPLAHRMTADQGLQPRRAPGEPRGGIRQDNRFRRLHAAERIADPRALGCDLALSQRFRLVRGVGPFEFVATRLRNHLR